jgi:O-antigen biosynthesis protein
MKMFLIKIGKAINALKKDGLVKGAANISTRLFVFIKLLLPLGSGDVLFITSGVGDSARYRAHHVAEELEIHGLCSAVTIQDNPSLAHYADKFKIFVFHRIIYTPAIEKLLRKIKEQNKEIIFDTDDLLFDEAYLAQSDYLNNINDLEKKAYAKGLGAEILNDPYVKVCMTTTTYLADKLRERGKKVFVVPNKLSNKDLEMTDVILSERKRIKESNQNNNTIKIGYFSGTISHNKDFAVISDALMKIMEKYSHVELVLVGPLDIENKLNKFKDRVTQLPYVPRKKHFENVSMVDVNLLPLETGNPYCESKSELKFFEAGILGVPTVASGTQTLREAIIDGEDGYLADTKEEWENKLGQLIEDKKLRKRMGEKAREKTLQSYTNKNSSNELYYSYLRETLTEDRD